MEERLELLVQVAVEGAFPRGQWGSAIAPGDIVRPSPQEKSDLAASIIVVNLSLRRCQAVRIVSRTDSSAATLQPAGSR
jgi:hypothetical protein